MRSIQTKISLLTISAIFVSVLAVAAVILQSVQKWGNQYARENMVLLSDNQRSSIDDYLDSVEQSVNMVSHLAGEILDSFELIEADVVGADGFPGEGEEQRDYTGPEQSRLDEYLESYTFQVKSVMQSVANHTNGSISYFFRVNPQISRIVTGFFYTKQGGGGFLETNMSPLRASPSEEGYAAWYFEPLNKGRPVWLPPYFNENDKSTVLTYVVPLFSAGTFVGVIGMDINFETLKDQLDALVIYETGYACLTDQEGAVIYHPELEYGEQFAALDVTLIEGIQNQQIGKTSLIEYTFEGERKMAALSFLSNDLLLLLTAPVSEVNAAWMSMLQTIILVTMVIVILFTLVITLTTRSIIAPLKRLTAASAAMAQGNYDIELNYNGRDEVGVLTQSFLQLTDHLKVYIRDLNSKAYVDALTRVRNKAAFDIISTKLDDQIRMAKKTENPEPFSFAIVMIDCNELKQINDNHGHDKGDIYLRNACHMICTVFAHSPVFRIGGDEFVAILQGNDYDQRRELLKNIDAYQDSANEKAVNPWDRVCVAYGLAEYEEGKDNGTDDVLKNADSRMYENKGEWKHQHGKA